MHDFKITPIIAAIVLELDYERFDRILNIEIAYRKDSEICDDTYGMGAITVIDASLRFAKLLENRERYVEKLERKKDHLINERPATIVQGGDGLSTEAVNLSSSSERGDRSSL
jgi:hypothetical protein